MTEPKRLRPVDQLRPKASSQHDEWLTEFLDGDRPYKRSNVYTRSTNKFDHSHTIHTALPKDVVAQIRELVASGDVPEFRSDHDFIRDSIAHNLHYYNEELGRDKAKERLNRELIISRQDLDQLEREDLSGIVERAKRALDETRYSDDTIGYNRALDLVKNVASTVREPYRSKLLDLLPSDEKARFLSLLDADEKSE